TPMNLAASRLSRLVIRYRPAMESDRIPYSFKVIFDRIRVMRSRSALPAWLTVLLLLAQAAHGQEIRKMAFMLGAGQDELQVDISYHDPVEIDARLKGSRLLPVKLSVTNVSSRPVSLAYGDFKLNLNGNQSLAPVDAPAVADELR